MSQTPIFDDFIKKMLDHHKEKENVEFHYELTSSFKPDIKMTLDVEEMKDEIDRRLSSAHGIAINIQDICCDDKTHAFRYQGRNVVLFIPDHSGQVYINGEPTGKTKFSELEKGNINAGNRVHLTECTRLKERKEEGSFDRYYASQNKNGIFTVYDKNRKALDTRLPVCMNCLDELNYKDFAYCRREERIQIRDNFSFKEFFAECDSRFYEMPKFTGQNTGGYPDNWKEISFKYRQARNFTCEQCHINLNDHRRLLHTHHINGNKMECLPENLEALCVECHAKEHKHVEIALNKDKQTLDLLRQLRRKQGLG